MKNYLFRKISSIIGIACSLVILSGMDVAVGGNMLGGEITWVCVGTDSFMMKVVLYRDCNGAGYYLQPLNFKSNSPFFDANLNLTLSSTVDITPTCKASCTRCQSPACSFPYGIEKTINIGLMVLNKIPTGCCKLTVSYSLVGSRDDNITTGAANQNLYIEATLDRCQSPCDNSPQFTVDPVFIACVGQDFYFNNGVTQVKGSNDSLSYSWTPPLQSNGTATTWASPFDYYKPISFYGFPSTGLPFPLGYHLDPVSGDIQFRPMKVETSIMTLLVSQFRNNVKIGEIRRDVEIIVVNCPTNHPPTLGPANYYQEVCAGTTATFTINTNDIDPTDTVTISWSKSIKGVNWTDNNGLVKHASGNFSWKTALSDGSLTPYTFTVTAKDNACPMPGTYTHAYQVLVKSSPEAIYTVTDSGCGHYYFNARATVGTSPTFLWAGKGFAFIPTSGPLTKHYFQANGIYPWSLTITSNLCSTTYYDTVKTGNYLSVYLPNDTVLCKGTIFKINATVTNSHGKVRYKWNTGDTIHSSITIHALYDSVYTVKISDDKSCVFKGSVKISVNDNPLVNAGRDTAICSGSSLIRTGACVFGKYSNQLNYKWYTTLDTHSLTNKLSVILKNAANYVFYAFDENKCHNSDTFKMTLNSLPKVFAGNDDTVCSAMGLYLLTGKPTSPSSSWIGLGSKYVASSKLWYFDPGANGIVDKGIYQLVYYCVDSNSCKNTDTLKIMVYKGAKTDAGSYSDQCLSSPLLQLNGYPSGGTWTGKGITAKTWFSPSAAGIGSHLLIYHYPASCDSVDSATVIVYDKPHLTLSTYNGDSVFCSGAGLIKLIGTPTGGTWSGTGISGSNFDPSVGQGNYKLYYTYGTGKCFSKDSITLRVKNSTKLVISTGNGKYEFCSDAGMIGLLASPSGGKWTGSGISGSYFDPSIGQGNYKLYYTYTNTVNCLSRDSILVKVHNSPKLSLSTFNGRFNFCSDEKKVQLIAIPSGGTWTGKGISGTYFNPSTGKGTYKIFYAYSDTNGCSKRDSLMINVSVSYVDITDSNLSVCRGQSVKVHASSLSSGGITWYKGSSSDALLVPDYMASLVNCTPGTKDLSAGYFQVYVKANDSICAVKYDSLKILVSPSPVSDFSASPTSGPKPLLVIFNNTSTISKGSIKNYYWDLGDGSFVITKSPVYYYGKPGTYDVTLITVSDKGCPDTMVKKAFVHVSGLAVPSNNQTGLITIVPNPAENYIIITILPDNQFITSLRLLKQDGKEVLTRNPLHAKKIRLDNPGKGIYLLEVNTSEEMKVLRKVVFE